MPDFEFDAHNGNKIQRDQLRINRSTGERTLVDVFTPQQGAKWEKPTRVLNPTEQWPPDPVPVPHVPEQGPTEVEILRAGILAWMIHGDTE